MADGAATTALLAQVTRAITDLANAQAGAANAAAEAAAAAAAVPIGGPPPVVPPLPVFASWPGLARNAFLDYNTVDPIATLCTQAYATSHSITRRSTKPKYYHSTYVHT
jgi:hypothetical protein